MTCEIYRVVFFTGEKIVLTENYQSKTKAENRIKNYVGGYPVRLELCSSEP